MDVLDPLGNVKSMRGIPPLRFPELDVQIKFLVEELPAGAEADEEGFKQRRIKELEAEMTTDCRAPADCPERGKRFQYGQARVFIFSPEDAGMQIAYELAKLYDVNSDMNGTRKKLRDLVLATTQ